MDNVNAALAQPGGPEADERWEAHVRTMAHVFPYPPTPNLVMGAQRRLARPASPRLRRTQVAWALGIVLTLTVGLLAVPQVRAAILDFLQIGGVRIFPVAPTSTPTLTPAPTSTPASGAQAAGTPFPSTATPRPTATLLPSLLDLAGETTLDKAQVSLGVPIPLPPDYGPPDLVFLQDLGGPMVVLVWLDPAQPDHVLLSLHLLTCQECATKIEPVVIRTTQVNGHPAVWAEGPYMLQLGNRDYGPRRLIDGHVLIWTDGRITYRLETDLTLEEAVRVAESLE